jgi:hypothetical protein
VAGLDAFPATLKKIKFTRMNFGKDDIFIRRYIYFVRGIRAMFWSLGWVRVGAAARMREEVKRRERTTPGFYTPVP